MLFRNLVSVEGFDSALTQTITAGSDFTLPDSVEVTYSDSKTPVAEAVTWDEASVKKADMSKPGTYQIPGTVSLSKEITRGAYKGKTSVDVTLTLQVKYANLITNKEAVEFDRGEYFTVDGATFKGIPSAENAKSGKTVWAGTEHPQQMVLLHIRKQLRWKKEPILLKHMPRGHSQM